LPISCSYKFVLSLRIQIRNQSHFIFWFFCGIEHRFIFVSFFSWYFPVYLFSNSEFFAFVAQCSSCLHSFPCILCIYLCSWIASSSLQLGTWRIHSCIYSLLRLILLCIIIPLFFSLIFLYALPTHNSVFKSEFIEEK